MYSRFIQLLHVYTREHYCQEWRWDDTSTIVCTALHRYSFIIASHATRSTINFRPSIPPPSFPRDEREQRRTERIPKIQHGISPIYEAAFPRRFVRARAAIAPLIISEIIFFRSQNRTRAPSLLRRGKVHLVGTGHGESTNIPSPLVPLGP